MKFTVKFFCFCSFALFLNFRSTAQSKKSILFIGNSYIYTNDLPLVLHDLALTFNDTLLYDSNTPGGTTLQNHSVNATTLSKISAQPWDYVVLQAQSQEPSFPPTQVETQTYPYAKILNDSIKNNNLCTEVVFFMTWGRKNGDTGNCPSYPSLCTYYGMQTRLRESYLHMADTNSATCSPVGMAWQKVRQDLPSIELYSPDESHPSIHGTYLAACVFYSTLFHKSSVGATFPSGINLSDATSLQTVASSIVLDSADVWNLDSEMPHAGFIYVHNGSGQFNITSTAENFDSVQWLFGDGGTSSQLNPQHTFVSSQPYTITQVVYNSCGSDTSFQVEQVTGFDPKQNKNNDYLIRQEGKTLHIANKLNKPFITKLLSIDGKEVYLSGKSTFVMLDINASGVYILNLKDGETDQVQIKKIIVQD